MAQLRLRNTAQPALSILENPSHKHYGPVRRLWIILEHFDLNGRMTEFCRSYGKPWTHVLTHALDDDMNFTESQAALYTMGVIFKHLGVNNEQ